MSIAVKFVCYSEWTDPITGRVDHAGTMTPLSITAAGSVVYDRAFTLATSTTATLYDTSQSTNPADFDTLFIVADQSIYLELTTDLDNSIGDELYTIPLTANLPFILGRDDSYANYTANFAGGTLDVIQRIRARNLSGSTSNIRIVAIT